jgi:hypothetical protein
MAASGAAAFLIRSERAERAVGAGDQPLVAPSPLGERPAPLGPGAPPADKPGMSSPSVSPAYQQIVDWYQQFQAVQQARPIPLLITSGAPDEDADQPKQTDSETQTLDIIA